MSSDKMNRRGFLKALGTIGAVAVIGPAFVGPVKQVVNGVWTDDGHGIGTDYQDYTAEDIIFTSCQQCNASCTIKTYIVEGNPSSPYSSIVRKIAGNQYSPIGMVPFGHINYDTPLEEAVRGTGDVARGGRSHRGAKTCLKGQAGIESRVPVDAERGRFRDFWREPNFRNLSGTIFPSWESTQLLS